MTDENSQEIFSNNELILVEFYAPWCPHCQKLYPDLVKIAKDMEKRGLKVAKVNADDPQNTPQITEKYGITNLPTLKIFRNGKEVDKFAGNKDYKSILDFYIQNAVDEPSVYSTCAEVAQATKDNEFV